MRSVGRQIVHSQCQTGGGRGDTTAFSAMEDQYNVLKREEERDMIPL
jgi:hypothetical protein